jgi:hypothetical protein
MTLSTQLNRLLALARWSVVLLQVVINGVLLSAYPLIWYKQRSQMLWAMSEYYSICCVLLAMIWLASIQHLQVHAPYFWILKMLKDSYIPKRNTTKFLTTMVKKHTLYHISTKTDFRKIEILEVLYEGCVQGTALSDSTDNYLFLLFTSCLKYYGIYFYVYILCNFSMPTD